MDTRIATTQIRMQNWVEIIQDRNASGLTIDDYCKASTGFARSVMPHWNQKASLSQKFRFRTFKPKWLPWTSSQNLQSRLEMPWFG